jgi:hypothetical protein
MTNRGDAILMDRRLKLGLLCVLLEFTYIVGLDGVGIGMGMI